jgi:CRP-like cAMP-binding protein
MSCTPRLISLGAMIGSVGRARIELLGQMLPFAACSKRQLEQVAALTVPFEHKKGTVMTRQGAIGGLAFIIVTGRAEVVRNGKRLALLGPGDVVGELSSLTVSHGRPR